MLCSPGLLCCRWLCTNFWCLYKASSLTACGETGEAGQHSPLFHKMQVILLSSQIHHSLFQRFSFLLSFLFQSGGYASHNLRCKACYLNYYLHVPVIIIVVIIIIVAIIIIIITLPDYYSCTVIIRLMFSFFILYVIYCLSVSFRKRF